MYCSYNYQLLKNKEFKDQKDSQAKNNYYPLNVNNNSWNGGLSSQDFSCYSKKNFYSNKRGQQGQSFYTLAIGHNAIVVYKNKKKDDKDLK